MFFCLLYVFHETAVTAIYAYWHTLALHDALPISAKRQFVLRRHSCNPLPISMPVEYRTLAESQPHRDNPGSSCRSFDSLPHGQPSRPSSPQTLQHRSFPPPYRKRGKLTESQGNLA